MKTKKLKTSRFDVADYLATADDRAAYLEACVEEAGNDGAFLAKALGDVARARGMTRVAKETGLTRESLYRSLSADGNPELETILRVAKSLGVRLSFKAA